MDNLADLKDIPYIAIGNGELDGNPLVGEDLICPQCNQLHKVEYGEEVLKDGTKVPSTLLAFYKCPKTDKSYLWGINGQQI